MLHVHVIRTWTYSCGEGCQCWVYPSRNACGEEGRVKLQLNDSYGKSNTPVTQEKSKLKFLVFATVCTYV